MCGKGICRECSNWAAGDIYLCPSCWQKNAPVQRATETRKPRAAGGGPFGAGLSRLFYYLTSLVIVIIGTWYVYATFVAPALTSGVAPPSISPLGDIWSHYGILITVSVSMFIVVLVGGELMLRPRTKPGPAVTTQPSEQPLTQPARNAPKQRPPVRTKPEVRALAQTLRTGPKNSRGTTTQSEVQFEPTQTRMVYCIYCGNKMPSTLLFCTKCGKGQE
jgi:hypothetical protein